MSAVFAGALLVGYLVLPGVNERIAALERDGKNREALRMLEQLFEQGDRSQRTLFQLLRLYEHFGDLERARGALEMLAAQRPKDAQVQRQLAQFYKLTQDEAGYLAALKSQLQARYSEPVCKELIGIHRRNGDFAAEQSTLSQCRQRGYRRPDDIIRLAYLVAADGDLVQASSLLRSVDDRRRLKVDRDRLMFFTALLEAGEAVEAQRRALRWLKGSRDDALALLLIDNLARESRHDLAIGLAREVGTPGDSVSLAVAELMLDREQGLAARSYLRGWLEAAKIRDVDVAQRFVSAALDAEDPELAFSGAHSFGLKHLGQAELAALAEALSVIGRQQLFHQVREAIEPATLSDNPLLAAAIEVERGASGPARQLLSRVEVDGLDEWRLALWARLMETTGQRSTAAQAMREIGVETPAAQPPPTPIIRRFRPPSGKQAAGELRPPRITARKRTPLQPVAVKKAKAAEDAPPPAARKTKAAEDAPPPAARRTKAVEDAQPPPATKVPRPVVVPSGG